MIPSDLSDLISFEMETRSSDVTEPTSNELVQIFFERYVPQEKWEEAKVRTFCAGPHPLKQSKTNVSAGSGIFRYCGAVASSGVPCKCCFHKGPSRIGRFKKLKRHCGMV